MKKLWKPVLLLAAVAIMAFGMLSSGAWFTDGATSTTTAIKSGTLSIEDAKLSEVSIANINNMAPGDKTGDMVVIIKNDGNLDLAWFGDLVIEGDPLLKDAIYIDFAQMEFLSPNGVNWQVEGTDNFILNGDGSGPYPDSYKAMALASPFGKVALSKFDGTSAMGVAPYEFNGALKQGYSYKLTLRFGFAEEADNLYQNKGPLSIKLAVKATQMKQGAVTAMGYPSVFSWLEAQIADQTEP